MAKSRLFSSENEIARRSTVAFAAIVVLGLWGCTQDEHQVTAPNNQSSGLAVARAQQPELDSALAVHRRHTFRLMAIPGVVGTAVGITANGRPAIKIFTKETGVVRLPSSLEGIPVEVQVTGRILAQPAQSTGTFSGCKGSSNPKTNCTTSAWPIPVPIGVSTGNVGQCSAGTIGARVKAGDTVYALSNNHVYALENTAPIGSNVLQPGLFDTGCAATGSNVIGTLSAFAPIAFCGSTCPENTIDAAIAATDATRLDTWTGPGGYGQPNSVVGTASLGLGVQKYGRTTSLTPGQVTGIDATVDVQYGTGPARFVHQVMVSNCASFDGSSFCSRPGDSGSLWVTNDASRNPVALNFAGNDIGTVAFANPIDRVLAFFGAVSVDTSPSPSALGGLTASTQGAGCGFSCAEAVIVSVTASGSNVITVKDNYRHTGTITLSGATALGGLTANTQGTQCGFPNSCASPVIVSVTASGSNAITMADNYGHTGTITVSGATALGGLTANTHGKQCGFPNSCAVPVIVSVTAGSKWISATDNYGYGGHIRLSF